MAFRYAAKRPLPSACAAAWAQRFNGAVLLYTPPSQLVELGPVVPRWPALLDFESADDAIGWSTDTGITACGRYGMHGCCAVKWVGGKIKHGNGQGRRRRAHAHAAASFPVPPLCAGNVFGGFGSGKNGVERTFRNLPAHDGLTLSFTYVFVDTW